MSCLIDEIYLVMKSEVYTKTLYITIYIDAGHTGMKQHHKYEDKEVVLVKTNDGPF